MTNQLTPRPTGIASSLTPDEYQNFIQAISLVSFKGMSELILEMDLTPDELDEFTHLTNTFVTTPATHAAMYAAKMNFKAGYFMSSLFWALVREASASRPQWHVNAEGLIDLAHGVLRDSDPLDENSAADVSVCARAMSSVVVRKLVCKEVSDRRKYLSQHGRWQPKLVRIAEVKGGKTRREWARVRHEAIPLSRIVDQFIALLDERGEE